jgi:phosphate starvation-inducible membrane PsiE
MFLNVFLIRFSLHITSMHIDLQNSCFEVEHEIAILFMYLAFSICMPSSLQKRFRFRYCAGVAPLH